MRRVHGLMAIAAGVLLLTACGGSESPPAQSPQDVPVMRASGVTEVGSLEKAAQLVGFMPITPEFLPPEVESRRPAIGIERDDDGRYSTVAMIYRDRDGTGILRI